MTRRTGTRCNATDFILLLWVCGRCRTLRDPPGDRTLPAPGSLLLVLVKPDRDRGVLPLGPRPSVPTATLEAPQTAPPTSQLAVPPMEEATEVEEMRELRRTSGFAWVCVAHIGHRV